MSDTSFLIINYFILKIQRKLLVENIISNKIKLILWEEIIDNFNQNVVPEKL